MNIKTPVSRKWRFAKPKTPVWMDTVCAVLIAVAAHLLFFGVFNYDMPAGEGRKTGSHLTLCNISGMPQEAQKNALKWISIHDPGLSVRGDSPVGFSSYLPQGKRRSIAVGEFRPAMDLPQVSELKYTPLKKKEIERDPMPDWIPAKQQALKKVKVLDMRGKAFELPLDIPADYIPGSNEFAVRGEGDFRRIEVLKPLSALQDQLVVNALLKSDAADGERVTVLWMRGEK